MAKKEDEKEKSYKIKIPVFTTEMFDETDGLFGRMTYSEMVEGLNKNQCYSVRVEF
jgi:hypothetical protein